MSLPHAACLYITHSVYSDDALLRRISQHQHVNHPIQIVRQQRVALQATVNIAENLTALQQDVDTIYLVLDAGVQCTIVDKPAVMCEQKNTQITVVVEPGALCLWVTQQQQLDITVMVEQQASMRIVLLTAAISDVSQKISLHLHGRAAQAYVHALHQLNNNSTATLFTQQQHYAADTHSGVVMRAVVHDQAVSRYRGMITIDKSGVGADAQQDHKALLLGASAYAVAEPMLEVLQNQVQCGHGSAIGRIDDQQLWYLQARGIAYQHARTLLLEPFLRQAVSGIDVPELDVFMSSL